MRQLFVIAAILLFFAKPGLAQEQLVVGKTYSGSIKLYSQNGGIYLALPEGDWILASYEETLSKPQVGSVVPMKYGRLLSTDSQKRVVGVVSFGAGNAAGPSGEGWNAPAYCSRKDLFFLDAKVQRRGQREVSCFGIGAGGTVMPAATASNYVREFYQHVAKNGLKLPQTSIFITIVRTSGAKYLTVDYLRNPEIDGFPSSAASVWQKDNVVGDAKRLKYLEDAKAWGKQWQPTFEAAFNGRPISQPNATPVAVSTTNSQPSMARQLEELKNIFEKKLITDEEYAERKNIILNKSMP